MPAATASVGFRLVVAALVASAPALSADAIAGRVVDASGAGVPGVDIDVKNLGSGGTPPISNDGTDANGFFNTTLPAGVYRVMFFPPQPPASSHLTAVVDQVVVIGTTDMGVISLPPGVVVSGRFLGPSGLPVAGVNVDVIDLLTGNNLLMKGDTSNALGNFAVAAPPNAVRLDFLTAPVFGQTLAPESLELALSGDLNLGDLPLEQGFRLTGSVQRSSGTAVAGVDLDVLDAASGAKLFTPADNTNSAGAFSVVVPAGTFDVELCPTFASRLVGSDREGVVVAADTSLGNIVLESGVVLSGTVRNTAGTPIPGIDVDVGFTTTGLSVVTCGDNTGAAGTYQVVVPTGTLDVGFAPPGLHGTSGEDLHAGVLVSGDTVLDGILPDPLAAFSGAPLAGGPPLQVSFSDLSTGAVTSWSWSFGDGDASALRNPSHIYSALGVYTVSLVASGPGGADTETKAGYVVVQEPAPAAGFSGTPLSGGSPLEVSFTDLSSGPITSRSWDFGDGSSSTLSSPSHIYTTAGSYTVSLTVSGPGGADIETKVGYIAVHKLQGPPIARFSGTPLAGSAPLAVSFTDLSVGTVTSRLWSFGDGGSSAQRNPGHTYAAPGAYTVSLTVSGPGGTGVETKSGYVVVQEPPPVAEFSGTPLVGIAPLALSFTDLSSGPITSRLWDFGDGESSTLASPGHVYATAGTYSVSLTVSGPGGQDTETKAGYVVVHEPARADFSATPPGGFAPLAVSFSDLSGGSITSWSWDFGDGESSTLASPGHVYTAAGTYTVSLTVSGPGGTDVETKVDYIVVQEPPPVAEFSGTPLEGIAPVDVSFTDLSGGSITSWSWDFGDGESSTLSSPGHIYATAGTYTVSLTVSGPGGTDVETKTGYVLVQEPPPVAEFSATPLESIAPLAVSFSDLSGGAITSWSWDFGDGESSSEQHPLHLYATPGTYTVSLTVSGPGGVDVETKADYVLVQEPPPVAEFSGTPLAGIAPLSVSFSDLSGGAITGYLWDFGDGESSTEQHPVHLYATPGAYTVSLTVSGPGGTDVETKADLVVVQEPPPVAQFSATPLAGIAPLAVSFSDLSSGAITSHIWDFGDGSSSTQPSPGHVYTVPGIYTVSLTVSGPGGADTESRLVTVVGRKHVPAGSPPVPSPRP